MVEGPASEPRRVPAWPRGRRWSQAKAALVGFLTGRGYSSRAIADILGDGTISATVRAMWLKWHLPEHGLSATGNEVTIPIWLKTADHRLLQQRASAAGCSTAEWLERILVCAAGDDMYAAIVG